MMWRRLAQILGLVLCMLGWGFVGCTLAMDYWRVAQLGGRGGSSVVVTAWYWSDLWRDCYEDSKAVVNCVDFGLLWKGHSYVGITGGLLMIGLFFGLIGTVLIFFGLECTYIGGDQRSNDRMLMAASALHLVGCVSAMAAYCVYINRVVGAFLHIKADPSKLRYEMGPALYVGLVGSFLILLGCGGLCATACHVNHPKRRHAMNHFLCEKGEEKEAFRRQKHIYGPPKVSNNSRHISPYKMSSVVTV